LINFERLHYNTVADLKPSSATAKS